MDVNDETKQIFATCQGCGVQWWAALEIMPCECPDETEVLLEMKDITE